MACRNSLKSENRQQSFNSMDMSAENHINSLSREMPSKAHNETIGSAQASFRQKSVQVTSSMKEKLRELEQRIKQKSQHVTQLEATLETILNPRSGKRLSETQSVELIC